MSYTEFAVTDRPTDLPNFARPPVSEVVMSIQFATLASLHSYHIGLLRERVIARYPKISEQVALPPVFETFGGKVVQSQQMRFEALLSPPMPRYWFEAEDGSLLQIQQDRVLHNWRKLEDDQTYPRYETVREEFVKDVQIFAEFLRDHRLGDMEPNQSEISYVNTIQIPEVPDMQKVLDRIVSVWQAPPITIGEIEATTIQSRSILRKAGEPYARMHLTVQPAILVASQTPCIRMDITVRGKPADSTIPSAFAFFDDGRDAIVRGFTDLTTPEMHELWGRTK